MEHKIIMAGFGGQGIMAMGQLVTYAGMVEGKNVSWLPSYGPEMRGGTANCAVIVSDKPVGAPTVSKYDVGVFMNELSLKKFEKEALPGATLFINSSLVSSKVQRDDVTVHYVPVNEIAQDEIGNAKTANMVMLGAVLAGVDIVNRDTVMDVFTKVFGEKREKLKPMNDDAMKAGANALEKEEVKA